MTRSQVRAACRRMRDHVEEIEEEAGELNLVPFMDIVTNIIIFLLASVVNQVALGNINVSVPTIGSGGASSEDTPPPEKPPLNLTVSVGASGFTVAASGGVLPLIPKMSNGQYDYKKLTDKLKEIKSNPDNAHRDQGELQRRRQHPVRHRRRHAGCHETGRRRQDPVPGRRLRSGDFVTMPMANEMSRASKARRRFARMRGSCPSPRSSRTSTSPR